MPSESDILEILKTISSWVATNLFSVERIIQYGIVITGLLISYFLVKIVYKKLDLLPVEEKIHRLKAIFYRLIQRLAFPIFLLSGFSLLK